MCDRVIVMNQGKIVESGKSFEVFNSPKNPYTKALVEAIPRFEKWPQILIYFRNLIQFLGKGRNKLRSITNLEDIMKISKTALHLVSLDLDEVCEMIAEGCSLAQIGAKFERSRNVLWKFLQKNEEHPQAYPVALQERGFHHANMIERLVSK